MKRLRTIAVSVPEMNEILKRNSIKHVHFRPIDEFDRVNNSIYIDDRLVSLTATCTHYGVTATYICRKDSEDQIQSIMGSDAFTQIARDYSVRAGHKIPRYQMTESAQPLLMYRTAYDKKRVEAIGYDLNKAYMFALQNDMPDTREVIRRNDFVRKGEIGFYNAPIPIPNGFIMYQRDSLQVAHEGQYATWIFPMLKEPPFKDFSERWAKRAAEAQTKEEKQKAKDMANFSVGYLQRVNPFLRATVIGACNQYIMSRIDKNTIYCNTDCIVSLEERPDLPISDNIGEFKIEHRGLFAHVGFNTQWNEEKPSYRGIPKSWFDDGYDILEGRIPDNGNVWEFDYEKMKLIRRKSNG